MSATDPRKLLAAARKSRRIASPYASYSLAGALFCNICANTPIKSESLWDAHTASPQHKANVARKDGVASSREGAAGKSNKRPAESTPSHDREGATTKRLKVARADVKNLALPVGFFDDDDDDDDDVAANTAEVIEPDDNHTPTNAVATAAGITNSKLPADFFSSATGPNNGKPEKDDLDDEWAAFQADIAQAEEAEMDSLDPAAATTSAPFDAKPSYTISAPALSAAQIQQQQQSTNPAAADNTRGLAEEEMEDARAAMADFFEEQYSLEERVQKLKERREMLRHSNDSASVPERIHPVRSNSIRSVTMGGMDESPSAAGSLGVRQDTTVATGDDGSDIEDEDYEDDEDMFFRRR